MGPIQTALVLALARTAAGNVQPIKPNPGLDGEPEFKLDVQVADEWWEMNNKLPQSVKRSENGVPGYINEEGKVVFQKKKLTPATSTSRKTKKKNIAKTNKRPVSKHKKTKVKPKEKPSKPTGKMSGRHSVTTLFSTLLIFLTACEEHFVGPVSIQQYLLRFLACCVASVYEDARKCQGLFEAQGPAS